MAASLTCTPSIAIGVSALSQWNPAVDQLESGIAIGGNALWQSVTGNDNVAVGESAMYSMTSGANNIGIGADALHQCVSYSGNTAVGALRPIISMVRRLPCLDFQRRKNLTWDASCRGGFRRVAGGCFCVRISKHGYWR